MRLFYHGKDGGKDSVVHGYWLIEIKSLFSIALLCFEDGSREEFHSHAFNCISWLIKGRLREEQIDPNKPWESYTLLHHTPSIKPVLTNRNTFHRVFSFGRSWVLTFRGPWAKQWKEFDPRTKEFITLESGRKVVETSGLR